MKLLPVTEEPTKPIPEYLTITDEELGLVDYDGESFEALRKKVLQKEEGKQDIVVPLSDLSFVELETIEVKDYGRLRLSELAFYQLCMRVKVPPDYVMRCPLGLRNANLAYWIDQHEERKVLLRTRDSDQLNGTRGILRAVLPHTYEAIDNLRILEWVALALKQTNSQPEEGPSPPGPRLGIHSYRIAEESTHIRLLFPNAVNVADGEEPDYQDNHFFGLHISDSEVGERSFVLDFLDYRSQHENFCLHLIDKDHLLTQRHIFIDFKFLLADFLQVVKGLPEFHAGVKNILLAARRVAIGDVQTHIRKYMRHVRQTNEFTESVLAAYQTEPVSTRYHIGQAISRAATRLSLDSRLNMELISGNYLAEGA